MDAIIQHLIGTTQEWEIENPILFEAVWGFEKTISGKLLAKLGDGKNPWNDLEYFDSKNVHGLTDIISNLTANIKEIESKVNGISDMIAKLSKETKEDQINTEEIEP